MRECLRVKSSYEGLPTGEIFGWQTWSGIVMSTDLLAGRSSAAHVRAMFSVDEATTATIRLVFEESGELSAAIELRRHFPEIKDNEAARLCVRAIAGWKPLPPLPPTSSRARRIRSSMQ
jgi:hypothetical protein